MHEGTDSMALDMQMNGSKWVRYKRPAVAGVGHIERSLSSDMDRGSKETTASLFLPLDWGFL